MSPRSNQATQFPRVSITLRPSFGAFSLTPLPNSTRPDESWKKLANWAGFFLNFAERGR
jgi:hypothetical protein